jgi:hypothetical protein
VAEAIREAVLELKEIRKGLERRNEGSKNG